MAMCTPDRRIGAGESPSRDYQAAVPARKELRQLVHLVGEMSKLPLTASNRRKARQSTISRSCVAV